MSIEYASGPLSGEPEPLAIARIGTAGAIIYAVFFCIQGGSIIKQAVKKEKEAQFVLDKTIQLRHTALCSSFVELFLLP